ncbi:MAG: EthD domain-containing protein [Mycobacterium sp.]|nr:EthD domain-containing protein [Mycobacterium sp.]
MEKVIVALRRPDSDDEWIARLRGPIAAALLDLDLPGVTLNLRDGAVRDSLMTLTTLDPPVQGFVSLWTQQYYGTEIDEALRMLRAEADDVAAYLVTESVPMPPPGSLPGERASGMANMALLRRPAELDEQTWLRRWHHDHTPVAIATQSTFGYVQNFVVRPLTAEAPPLAAIVEELFPIEAVRSLHAFFGASDDADLTDRLNKMVASTAAFGANVDVDTVPTGRYVFRNPFGS